MDYNMGVFRESKKRGLKEKSPGVTTATHRALSSRYLLVDDSGEAAVVPDALADCCCPCAAGTEAASPDDAEAVADADAAGSVFCVSFCVSV